MGTVYATGNILHILLTKTTAAQNGVVRSYHKVRGLYFLAVVFVRRISKDDFGLYKTLEDVNVRILY